MTVSGSYYDVKSQDYFNNPRKDIFPLLPKEIDNVLEVGCGNGSTLRWLKTARDCSSVIGIELFLAAAEAAREQLDHVIHDNIETMTLPFEKSSFDLILCLDVLEHLVDPWLVVKRLTDLLKPGGCLIASIPNVKHHSVIRPLLLGGKWNYSDLGVLDKTHLRFFTRSSAIELVQSGGLTADLILSTGREKNTKSKIANILTLGIFKVFFETQYVIRAVKA